MLLRVTAVDGKVLTGRRKWENKRKKRGELSLKNSLDSDNFHLVEDHLTANRKQA